MSQAAIRMSGTNSGESLDAVIIRASQRLGYSSVRDKQLLAIRTFMEGNDVFISLPTGSGKSLYYALPYAFDDLYHRTMPQNCSFCVL